MAIADRQHEVAPRDGNFAAQRSDRSSVRVQTISAYADWITPKPYETVIRSQTVDTFADGTTPNTREAAAAARIRAQRPGDELILIPKRKP